MDLLGLLKVSFSKLPSTSFKSCNKTGRVLESHFFITLSAAICTILKRAVYFPYSPIIMGRTAESIGKLNVKKELFIRFEAKKVLWGPNEPILKLNSDLEYWDMMTDENIGGFSRCKMKVNADNGLSLQWFGILGTGFSNTVFIV